MKTSRTNSDNVFDGLQFVGVSNASQPGGDAFPRLLKKAPM